MAITCVGLIPAEETVDPAAGLNVLVMAINSADREATAAVSLFGCVEQETRLLCARNCTLKAGEHAHLYFHIPAQCFSESFWGTECDELTISAGTDSPQCEGKLIFVE